MKNFFSITSIIALLFSSIYTVSAWEYSWGISTWTQTWVDGVVIDSPVFSPSTWSYTSSQSVSIDNSWAPYSCYTSNWDSPSCNWETATCDSWTKYIAWDTFSVSTTTTLKALSCYQLWAESSISSATISISVSSWWWSSGWWWWSSYPTCKDEQLECRTLSSGISKYYRLDWETCTGWKLYTICEVSETSSTWTSSNWWNQESSLDPVQKDKKLFPSEYWYDFGFIIKNKLNRGALLLKIWNEIYKKIDADKVDYLIKVDKSNNDLKRVSSDYVYYLLKSIDKYISVKWTISETLLKKEALETLKKFLTSYENYKKVDFKYIETEKVWDYYFYVFKNNKVLNKAFSKTQTKIYNSIMWEFFEDDRKNILKSYNNFILNIALYLKFKDNLSKKEVLKYYLELKPYLN